MRIIVLSNCDLVESQGSGYVIINFARGLRSRGHEVKMLGPGACCFMPSLRQARSLRLALGMWYQSIREVASMKPDIVEFYGGEAWLATDRLSRRTRRRFRIVAHSNGIEPLAAEMLAHHGIGVRTQDKTLKWYQGRLHPPIAKAFSRADAVVTVSQPEADYVIRNAFQPAESVLAIDNALPEEFLGQPVDFNRPNIIGFCGSWLPRKGVGVLGPDLSRVLREEPNWKLHLVGVGPNFRPESHFENEVIKQIITTEFVGNKSDLRLIYNTWAIALMPSAYESFGLVAAEAMACGCALVAGRTGFAANLLDGEEALLLAELRSPLLYVAIRRLIADGTIRRQIAGAGWKRVQRLRWKDNIDRIEKFYRKLTESNGPEVPSPRAVRI